jgi:hypothetical protein
MSPFLLALALSAAPTSHASELSPYLAPERTLLEHARAVSLDVRGVVLTLDEVEAIRTAGELDDATLDSWLASEGFADQVVRHHQTLFLNNVDPYGERLRYLRGYYASSGYIFYTYYRQHQLRDGGACTGYDADVNALNQPQSWITRSDGSIDEGAVDVVPWWDSTVTLRVCARDAQLTEISSSGNDCRTLEGDGDTECGCGPNLKWCNFEYRSGHEDFNRSMSEAISRRVWDVVYEDRDYTTLLTEPSIYVNGPLVDFYKNRVGFSNVFELPVPVEDLPDIPRDDFDTWVNLPTDTHYAGALTEPGWLLRFTTNRGRANRFFTEFLCGEFLPPEGGIMEIAEENPTPDLSQKPVCMDCHTVLEPWSAYWGRWRESGTVYYSEEVYPTYSEECAACAPYCGSTTGCGDYMLNPEHPHEEPYVGYFKPYVFLFGDMQDHPTMGPALWAETISDDGRLARCAAEKAAIWLLGKPEREISAEVIDGWADDFTASGLSYQALVRAIVTSPAYGRAR